MEGFNLGVDVSNGGSDVSDLDVVVSDELFRGSNAGFEGSLLVLGIFQSLLEVLDQVVGLGEFKSVIGDSVSLIIVLFLKGGEFFLITGNSGFFWGNLSSNGIDLVVEVVKSGNEVSNSSFNVGDSKSNSFSVGSSDFTLESGDFGFSTSDDGSELISSEVLSGNSSLD